MLYQILKPIVTLAAHIFYKKIVIVKRERLNEKIPTLIVSNHNNAFLDAVVVEMFAKPQIYSLARGDVFGNPFIRSILSALRIIPIYRKEEAEDMLEKNEVTFEQCIALLEQKEQIIIYPEGDCVTEKRLRKLKKGTGRIALRAEAKNNFELNVRVLPIGLNYSAAKNFRSKLFINVGEPIYLKEYQAQYAQDAVKAINSLTQRIENKMRALVVDIEHRASDKLYEDVLALYKSSWIKSKGLDENNLQHDYQVNCAIANAINYWQNENPTDLENFKQNIRQYHLMLDKLNVPSRLFSKQNIDALNFISTSKDLFLVGVGMPLHIMGIALNYLPYRFAYNTADKKVKQVHFHASVNFVIGLFGWIGYYIFQLLLIALFLQNWMITIFFSLLIPATGLYSLHFYSFLKKTFVQWNLFSLAQNSSEVVEQMLVHREELVAEFQMRSKE